MGPIRLRPLASPVLLLLFGLLSIASVWGDEASKAFDIPAGDAETSLKIFSRQSGCGVIYVSERVQGVTTRAVRGELWPKEAIDQMLAGTALTATRDERTGAFAISRQADPGPQQTSAPAAADPPPAPATPPAPSEGQTVSLDPFEVQATQDNSYGALNSNSITAFNVSLEKMPVSADIFDQTFMQDVGATSVESLVTGFSAGAGMTSPDPSSASVSALNQPGDRVSHGHLALRGLSTEYSLRDSLLPNGYPTEPGSTGPGFTSSFDVDRVEIVNGPQALLYGATGGGGVVDMVSKQAEIGAPAFGSVTYQLDQYGGKLAQFDYGASTNTVAVRVAIIDQSIDTSRINIGGPLDGYYLQAAFRLFGNTTIRIEGEETYYDHQVPRSLTLDAGSSATDSRNGDYLTYLLATNQIAQAASGPSGAGPIDNGFLNWSDAYSYYGWYWGEITVDDYEIASLDTKWNDWLSTTVELGHENWDDNLTEGTDAFYSPGATGNPLPGNWAVADTATEPNENEISGVWTKALRVLALATNDLFGGKQNSRSIVEADFLSTRFSTVDYGLYETGANGNILVNPAVTTLNSTGTPGYTTIPELSWAVNNGPITYPLFRPSAYSVNYQGENYVRAIENPANPQAISPADPNGVTLGGGGYDAGRLISRAVSATNVTDWLNGNLTTLVGLRLEQAFDEEFSEGSAPPASPDAAVVAGATELNYNVGANYRLTDLIRPYVSFSNSYAKPPTLGHTAYAGTVGLVHSIGEEGGFKVQNEDGSLSGSIACYHVESKNDEMEISSTIVDEINPSGLNGIYGGVRGAYQEMNDGSEGVELTLAAAPTKNWRLRLSAGWNDGTIQTAASYPQLYNDQFYENSQGEVTYADGNVVYVPATFNSKTLTVPSTTAGAVPLTTTLLSTPTSAYYADPKVIDGQITASSNGGKVLKGGTDPANPGSGILTGATGLPISDYQLIPSLTGVSLPGTIVVAQAGDATTGYPELSSILTSVYEFPSGWEKGIELGGSINLGWLYRDFYYYPDGYTSAASPRSIFYLPNPTTFNLIAGYTRKFGRITWHSQLNVSNLFNHYSVVLIPGEIDGWTSAADVQATLSQQPRYYMWTNRLSF